MWRLIRIGLLLLVLVVVALGTLADRRRTAAWNSTLWVGIFPANGDGRAATDAYIARLTPRQFADIEEFFRREAQHHGLQLERPVHIELYPRVVQLPPRLDADAGLPDRAWWSLKARHYAWRNARGTLADIRVFVLYHDPQQVEAVPHSLGLQKGLLGIVYAYADEAADATNNIVIAHEVMHALGATDKYDPATNQPRYPQGYGDPRAEPRYPQALAEIMAGRRALAPDEAALPEGLAEVVVGRETAVEVNWIAP